MARLWSAFTEVEDVEFDASGAPVTFAVSGKRYRVQEILQTVEIDKGWASEQGRRYRIQFVLVTEDGEILGLLFDLLEEAWFLFEKYA